MELGDPTDGLTAAGALGPFFAVALRPPDPAGAAWCPAGDLVRYPGCLHGRTEATRQRLADLAGLECAAVEPRTAASLTHLGLTARIVSPTLGAAVLSDVLPVVGIDSWLLGPPGAGPVPVAARAVRGACCATSEALAAGLVEHCLEPVIRPLVDAFATAFDLSRKVLWGNAASAVAGAAGMVIRARPALAAKTAATVAALLRDGPLSGTGSWVRLDRARPRYFLVRRSCCLLYRLPGAAPCGDCILLPPDIRQRQWAAEERDR